MAVIMAQKCVHTGCGKEYTDENETCLYHPGPPIFHEGQKGWKCCKPRVLTFDEFLSIPPCTEGKHSTTDLPPQIEKKEQTAGTATPPASEPATSPAIPRAPIVAPASAPTPPPPPPESEDDDASLEIPDGKECRRKGCHAKYKKGASREGEKCVHHPGVPIFHEGSKGYSCCKRRVLEFDQFMKLEGCETKNRHLFIGSGNKGAPKAQAGAEEKLETVRHDFYQSATSITVSFFLKKIDKAAAKIVFHPQSIALDLPTTDSPTPKRYTADVPLFAAIDPAKSAYKIMGTKLEVTLAKAEVSSWPVLRSDDRLTGEILQVGRAANVAK